jgi:hypothetical protein
MKLTVCLAVLPKETGETAPARDRRAHYALAGRFCRTSCNAGWTCRERYEQWLPIP